MQRHQVKLTVEVFVQTSHDDPGRETLRRIAAQAVQLATEASQVERKHHLSYFIVASKHSHRNSQEKLGSTHHVVEAAEIGRLEDLGDTG